MTAEQTEPDVLNDTTTVGEANQTETPALQAIIRGVLEEHDGRCLDVPEEREELARALAFALRNSPFTSIPGQPDTKAGPLDKEVFRMIR